MNKFSHYIKALTDENPNNPILKGEDKCDHGLTGAGGFCREVQQGISIDLLAFVAEGYNRKPM